MASFRRIKRGPQLIAKLNKLRTGIQPEVQAGLLKAGAVINAEQKRLAPVLTGTLRDSLTYELARGAKSGNQTVKMFSTDFKAPWVEFGTVNMVAQPFFFVSFRSRRRQARSIIAKAVRESVKKAVS